MAHKKPPPPYKKGACYAEAAHNLILEIDHLRKRKNPAFIACTVTSMRDSSRKLYEEHIGPVLTHEALYADTIQLLQELNDKADALLEALNGKVLLRGKHASIIAEQEADVDLIARACLISIEAIMDSDKETAIYAFKRRQEFVRHCSMLKDNAPTIP